MRDGDPRGERRKLFGPEHVVPGHQEELAVTGRTCRGGNGGELRPASRAGGSKSLHAGISADELAAHFRLELVERLVGVPARRPEPGVEARRCPDRGALPWYRQGANRGPRRAAARGGRCWRSPRCGRFPGWTCAGRAAAEPEVGARGGVPDAAQLGQLCGHRLDDLVEARSMPRPSCPRGTAISSSHRHALCAGSTGGITEKKRWARPSLETRVPEDSAYVQEGRTISAASVVAWAVWSIAITWAAEASSAGAVSGAISRNRSVSATMRACPPRAR